MLATAAGCGNFAESTASRLFSVPLIVQGEPVGEAVIDTGGGYEILLREPFNLDVVGTVDVLAFGGRELVELTEGFAFYAGGIASQTPFAIVGLSACDCNGLGFHFFRKAELVVALDFSSHRVTFLPTLPVDGVTIPFEPPPAALVDFDTAFIPVRVAAGWEAPSPGSGVTVPALLDTGATVTVMRRDLLGENGARSGDRLNVTITHPILGTLGISAMLFDTSGLPDVILGLDVMRTWADRWYFSFTPGAGAVTVELREDGAQSGSNQVD